VNGCFVEIESVRELSHAEVGAVLRQVKQDAESFLQ